MESNLLFCIIWKIIGNYYLLTVKRAQRKTEATVETQGPQEGSRPRGTHRKAPGMYTHWKHKQHQPFLSDCERIYSDIFTFQPKIQVASKYERRVDTRSYDDKKKLFEGVSISITYQTFINEQIILYITQSRTYKICKWAVKSKSYLTSC